MRDAEYRTLAEFRYALRVFLRFSEDAARSVGLTPNQHQLLLAVRGAKDHPPTIGDVADRLQLRHNSTVELVDRAEAVGLVQRSVDPDDRRRHLLRCTSRGERLLETLSESHRSELRRFREEMAELLRELD